MATRQSKNKQASPPPRDIFVLTDDSGAGVRKFGAEQQIPVDKLRDHLKSFTAALSSALDSVQSVAGDFQLSEVEVTATFSAEAGFVWVTKAGFEGGVSLTFARKKP
jgi:hypothetical protein